MKKQQKISEQSRIHRQRQKINIFRNNAKRKKHCFIADNFRHKKAVAVVIDKNCNCIDAMLGALYAGDYYIVVDVHSPQDRIENILSTLGSAVIITDSASLDVANAVKGDNSVVLYEDAVKTAIDENALCAVRSAMIDMDTAYILFTSGSTGMPKGTVISHRALISYINWVTEEFGFDETTSFGSQTPLYFSMSVTDFYSSIKCGCTYNIIPKANFSFPLNLIAYLDEHEINTIYWVPTAISIISNWKAFDVAKPKYLKTVLFAGEVMPTKQLNYWIKSLDGVKFANLFGPTETTDICTFYVVDREFSNDESLPIGKHCDNCNVFIVTDDGKQAAPGEEGELYVRSTFMADGYYKNPEKQPRHSFKIRSTIATPKECIKQAILLNTTISASLFTYRARISKSSVWATASSLARLKRAPTALIR